jgi:hypothetical protein
MHRALVVATATALAVALAGCNWAKVDLHGDAIAGDATAGDATAGDATAGDATAGDATAGDPATGDADGIDGLDMTEAADAPVDAPPLIVGFSEYDGAYEGLDNAEIRLYKRASNGKPTCADLPLDHVSQTPATVVSPTIMIDGSFTFVTLPNLQEEGEQDYTIIGLARKGQGPTKAWACDDAHGHVVWGKATHVTLVWKDVPPWIVGSYDVTSAFDLIGGLPAGAMDAVRRAIDLTTDPAATLLLACEIAGQTGPLHDFCAAMFQDPSAPDPSQMTQAGETVLGMLDQMLLFAAMDACSCHPYPESCVQNGLWLDVAGDTLGSIQLLSTLTFIKEPDESGVIPASSAKDVWHSVRLRWPLCQACGPLDTDCGQKIGFGQIQGIDEAVAGSFDAMMEAGFSLSVSPHTIAMEYGALVNFVFENWIAPRFFGDGSDGLPAVRGFGPMLGWMLGGSKACLADADCYSEAATCDGCCASFADQVASQTGLDSVMLAAACRELVPKGAAYLRGALLGLDATPASLVIGTKTPCALFLDNDDLKTDSLGKQTAPCEWDAAWTIGDAEFEPAATFFGKAK